MAGVLRVRTLLGAAVAAVMATTVVAAPVRSGAESRQSALPAGFTDTIVWKGLKLPTAFAFAPDGRVFVALKGGVIDEFASLSARTPKVFADLSNQVQDLSDRGLLGLAVDPKLGTTGHNYVYALYAYDAPPGRTAPVWGDKCPTPPGADVDGCVVTGRLIRIAVNPDGSGGATKVLISNEWCQQYTSHSIGHLAFGSDGMLYVSGGEGSNYVDKADYGEYGGTLKNTPTPVNPCGDPPGRVGVADSSPTSEGGSLRAQSPRRPAGQPVLLSGALLRVNPKNGQGVPGNPMYTAAGKKGNASRIIAYGLRNPFRFTMRPGTSEIWVADVGENAYEEIDRVMGPTVTPAPNYGWPCYEGNPQYSAFSGFNMCKSLYADHSAIAPYDTYAHSSTLGSGDTCGIAGGSSVISAIAFAGANTNYPAAYHGALFFGDHSRSCIWVEPLGTNGQPNPAARKTFVDDSANPAPVDLETDPASGDLFYANVYGGAIHRISYHP